MNLIRADSSAVFVELPAGFEEERSRIIHDRERRRIDVGSEDKLAAISADELEEGGFAFESAGGFGKNDHAVRQINLADRLAVVGEIEAALPVLFDERLEQTDQVNAGKVAERVRQLLRGEIQIQVGDCVVVYGIAIAALEP